MFFKKSSSKNNINEEKNKRRSVKEISPKNKEELNEYILKQITKVKNLTITEVCNKNLFPTYEDLPVKEIKIEEEDFKLLQKIGYYKKQEENNLQLLSKSLKYEEEIKVYKKKMEEINKKK
jgi:hypothetical protein